MKTFGTSQVEAVFRTYPPKIRSRLLSLRQLVFDVAAVTEGVGALEETLKWGQPAYVTSETRSGSTVRIDRHPREPQKYAIYFHCQTNLVETFRMLFPQTFVFEGNRAIVFDESEEVPLRELGICVAAALTYHRQLKGQTLGRAGTRARRTRSR